VDCPRFDFFHEIWTPSDFVTAAIAIKSPVPVFTMPHAIAFARPAESTAALRARLGLPADKFLFLTLFDLNSYAERKNPRAVLAAFRASGLAHQGAALVLKVHNAAGNAADFAALRASVADLPGTVLLTETLSRADIYALEAACDCFVSLHRSEGFGLAVAEAMFLGKPVISTDWSATAEFVDSTNGCPVRAPSSRSTATTAPTPKAPRGPIPIPPTPPNACAASSPTARSAPRLGAAARATIETRFSPTAIGARYRRRLEVLSMM
jgi:glycosyltransferase involved in cell wall biosynthesis